MCGPNATDPAWGGQVGSVSRVQSFVISCLLLDIWHVRNVHVFQLAKRRAARRDASMYVRSQRGVGLTLNLLQCTCTIVSHMCV